MRHSMKKRTTFIVSLSCLFLYKDNQVSGAMVSEASTSPPAVEIVPPLEHQKSSTTRAFTHHVVVHFDINETILVGDEAGGDTRSDCLNKILAKSAFVRMPPDHQVSYDETSSLEPTHWWNGTPLQSMQSSDNDKPTATTAAATTTTTPPPLYIGWQWPEGCCPYYRTAFKKKAKTFTQHDGRPYRHLRQQLDQILQAHSVSGLPALDHMIPAFFHTLQALSKTPQKKTIVLRTFGTDLPDVAQAVTAFAQGRHPDYPNFGDPRLVLKPDTLVQGRWIQHADGTTVYQLYRNDQLVAAGDAQVLEFIHGHDILGIQDDYPFWQRAAYEPWAGKPVWKLPNIQHIILDDNIHNLEKDSIASVRRPTADGGYECLSDYDILQEHGRHLIRVPTIAPILHQTWFLEAIQEAQENFVKSLLVTETS